MSTSPLEEGYQRIYRDFYTQRNLFAGASPDPGTTGSARPPLLEAVLDGLGKVGQVRRKHPPQRQTAATDATVQAETYTP